VKDRLRSISVSAIAASLLAIASLGAQACDCAKRLGLKDSELVFVGTPVHRTEWQELPTRQDSIPSVRFSFKVERTLKGPQLAHAVVDTDRTDCGVPFEFGRRYQVYAYSLPKYGIQWRTSQCTETKLVDEKRP
jgi:hypothetical protein